MDSLTFVIPAYNDKTTIEMVVKKTIDVGNNLRIPFEVLVTDDASPDSTGHILKKLGKRYRNLHVITHAKNVGFGQTMKEMYQKARTTWLFSLPGDYQVDPHELLKLWRYRDKADMIIGWRRIRRDNPARLRQTYIYNLLLRMLFGLSIHDVNSVRLMKTSIMKSIILTKSSAFVDAELVVKSSLAGFRIIEVPIAHRKRAGEGASGGRLTTILPTIKDIILFRIRG